jgi:hypothetical protein
MEDIDYLLMTYVHILVTSNENCKQCVKKMKTWDLGKWLDWNKMHGTNFYFIEV